MVSHIRRKLPQRGMAIKGPRWYAAYLYISRFASRSALTKDAPGGPCALTNDLSIFVLFYGNDILRCYCVRMLVTAPDLAMRWKMIIRSTLSLFCFTYDELVDSFLDSRLYLDVQVSFDKVLSCIKNIQHTSM